MLNYKMYIFDTHNNNSYIVIAIINVFFFFLAKYKNILNISYFTPKRKEDSRCFKIYFYSILCFIIINL